MWTVIKKGLIAPLFPPLTCLILVQIVLLVNQTTEDHQSLLPKFRSGCSFSSPAAGEGQQWCHRSRRSEPRPGAHREQSSSCLKWSSNKLINKQLWAKQPLCQVWGCLWAFSSQPYLELSSYEWLRPLCAWSYFCSSLLSQSAQQGLSWHTDHAWALLLPLHLCKGLHTPSKAIWFWSHHRSKANIY